MLQDIQGIYASWTGLVSPESVEEWHSTPVAGTGRPGPRWPEEDGCPRVAMGLNFLGLVNVSVLLIASDATPVCHRRHVRGNE